MSVYYHSVQVIGDFIEQATVIIKGNLYRDRQKISVDISKQFFVYK